MNPWLFDPPLASDRAIDRELKRLRDAVGAHPALTLRPELGDTKGGRSRADQFAYDSRFTALPGVAATVRVEPGIQSGDHPIEGRQMSSLVADFLHEQGQGEIADDLTSFSMALLHFRRTFVEKLFTIHSKVRRLLEDGTAVGRDARHYADLHVLARQPEVIAMLESDEYAEIRGDYDTRSTRWFPQGHRPPPDLRFGDSEALFPSGELRKQLEADYREQCALLFPGEFATFDEVLGTFERIRQLI